MYFVSSTSIVRQIWGKGDTILFIFAGAAAEFALNKAVDWLYFTGRLPADPLGRLFSTVSYARTIVFAAEEKANAAIDRMRAIHGGVEASRGARIPDWAYRDVLFMLIHYSIAAFELLECRLTFAEKEEVFQVFYRVGHRMALAGLPQTFGEWEEMREQHLSQDMVKSTYTDDLFRQYRKHLGPVRYGLLLGGQQLVVPAQVKKLLRFGSIPWLLPVIKAYKLARLAGVHHAIRNLILPPAYRREINDLDNNATA